MRSILVALSFFISSFSCLGQISFQKGYFIDNNGQRTECLIKNVDWRYNPTQFQYKISETEKVQDGSIANIKEFASSTQFKFVRANVNVDRSSDLISNISNKWEPSFTSEQLFLQVLVEGDATLYVFKDSNFTRFFYKTGSLPIEQLVHKIYNDKGNYIKENNSYRQQLLEQLQCKDITFKRLQNVDYYEKDLAAIFIEYNSCADKLYTHYQDNKKWKEGINIHLRPGINYSSMSLGNSNASYRNSDFETSMNFRFGVEIELVMNFNKNKWSVFVEPTYLNYKGTGITVPKIQSINAPAIELSLQHTAVEVPMGLRHYLYLDDNSKLFIDVAYINDFSLKSEYTFNQNQKREVIFRDRVGIGFGYKFKNKYGAHVRYAFSRSGTNAVIADYNYLGLILNYTLFSGSN